MKIKSFNIQAFLILLICILVVLILAFSINIDDNTHDNSLLKDNSELGIIHNVDEPSCFCITVDGDFVLGTKNSIVTISANGKLNNTVKMEHPVTAVYASQEGLYAASGSTIYLINKDNNTSIISDLGSKSIIKSIRKVDNKLYISDAGNRLLYIFNLQGKLKHIYSFEKPHTLLIVSPWLDFIVLSDAKFWITNPGNHQIDLYSKEGKYIKSIPKSEETILFEGCCNPVLIEKISEKKLVTWEKGVKRLRVFDSEGKILDEINVNTYFQTELNLADMTYQNGILYLLDRNRIYSLKAGK